MTYPRGLVKGFKPFDPIKVSEETEKIIINGNKRRYNIFRIEDFYGQIATARGVGCNLRCGFCWINPSRDEPENYGKFYSPQEVYDKLVEVSSNKFGRAIMTSGVRISGCEPTLGREHLLSLVELCKKGTDKGLDFSWFLLETNGVLLGYDEDYVKALSEFGEYVIVRLSFKAGTPEAFERKTGAKAEYFDLPFCALAYLKKHKVLYRLAAMSQDPAIMPSEERRGLLEQIIKHGVDNLALLEEENADPFGITKKRLVASGIVNDLGDIRQERYESLRESFIQACKGKENMDAEELKKILKTIEFRIDKSPCTACTRNNPYHGHGVEHDLDEKLK